MPRLKLLAVCTHNRTRSVMMAALLERLLTAQLGAGGVMVRSSGFGPVGLPAIPDAVDAMRRRGLDVSAHLSTETTRRLVDGADVILTAERDHVVKIAALSPGAFRRTMTLPEFLRLSDPDAPPSTSPGAAGGSGGWTDVGRVDPGPSARIAELTAARPTGTYLRTPVPEIADPTGTPRRVFEAAVLDLERQCGEAARRLAALVEPAG